MHRIVFYSDSPYFGGNEKGAMNAHRATVREHAEICISWIISSSNPPLASALNRAGIDYVVLDLEPEFRLVRNPVAVRWKIHRIRQALRQIKPDLVVLVQGWILDAFDGVAGARAAGVPYCSYIPMTHSPVELGVHRLSHLRAAVLSLFYNRISRYITIDEQQARRLQRWHKGAQIDVVENYVPRASAGARTPKVRQELNLPAGSIVLGVVGRIDFRQKAQDWLVESLGSDSSFLQDKNLLMWGDGPDANRLAELIKMSRWHERIRLFGWSSDIDAVYGALDLLIIPSRAEGVPLVMIEALSRRIPVVGSDRDGMKTWLPAEWRFPFGDAEAMKRAIERALSPEAGRHWDDLECRLAVATDEHRLGREFGNILIRYSTDTVVSERSG